MSNLSEVWDWDCTEIGKSLQLDLLPVRTFKIVCHSLSLKVKLEDMYFASMWWYGIIHIYISLNVFVDSANFPYLLSTPFKENRIVFSVKTSFDCLSPRHISSCSPQCSVHNVYRLQDNIHEDTLHVLTRWRYCSVLKFPQTSGVDQWMVELWTNLREVFTSQSIDVKCTITFMLNGH